MANCPTIGSARATVVHIYSAVRVIAGPDRYQVTMRRRGSALRYTSHIRVAPDSQGTGRGSFSRGDCFTALADQVGDSETRRHGLLYYYRGVRRRESSIKSRKLRTLLAITTRRFLASRTAHMVVRPRVTSRTRLEASNP
jgi:hypothetical protein